MERNNSNPGILFMSTFPPTTCGIATYTTDLMNALTRKFGTAFSCDGLEMLRDGIPGFKYFISPERKQDYRRLALKINNNKRIKLIHIQHEFGLFGGEYGDHLFDFLETLSKPVVISFHTVLPHPNLLLKNVVTKLADFAQYITVMTRESKRILEHEYNISSSKIEYIQHGTHLVKIHQNNFLKKKYGFKDRLLLSTFGLLGPGKSIETALYALPDLIKRHPEILYLIIGKTHPGNIKNNQDEYRIFLKQEVEKYKLEDNVVFLDEYIQLPQLLELLQATDVYLFTSKDPNQAVSGTFSYAMSCGCPIIATSIPHTREILNHELGFLIEIGNHQQLAAAAEKLVSDHNLRKNMSFRAYQKTNATAWDNVAIKHAKIFHKLIGAGEPLQFKYPQIKLSHIKRLTTKHGMIQFSNISTPDIDSGYTLDDNARALIAMGMHYELFKTEEDLKLINLYLSFIDRCQTPTGTFVNYIDKNEKVHIKNDHVNLEDSNARAVWALGQIAGMRYILPEEITERASKYLLKSADWAENVLSPRAIGFSIKGLYLYQQAYPNKIFKNSIEKLASNLISRYDLNREKDWHWFEEYLTYANSILPEAMLYAYLNSGNEAYKKVALESFEFLLSKLFENGEFKVISNRGWYQKNSEPNRYGEQPIDVAYTIQALELFYTVFKNPEYKNKMELAFSWFLGNNHLNQIIYNPVTGGCADGLEQNNVNLNQGAESTVCYLMARLIMEKNKTRENKAAPKISLFNRKKANKSKSRTFYKLW